MFVNYELNKLNVANPDILNLLIILIFFFVVIMTAQKNEKFVYSDLLSKLHTDQLKGLGIFLVVLGHLWVHVSRENAKIVLSGEAVSLFLLLSGFGLAVSNKYDKLKFKEFFVKRFNRVMLPYWIATALIIILDFIILNRRLSINNLFMTIIGINTTAELYHLDYTRWFVTFILLWYVLFYIFFVKFFNKFKKLSIIAISIIILIFNYYILHFEWYQFLSFPVGCIIAIHYDKFKKKFSNNNFGILYSIICIIYVMLWKLLFANNDIYFVISHLIPNLFLVFINEINSLIICFSVIYISYYIIVKNQINSKILVILGKYSYGIFLTHGIFLIKYNFIIKSTDFFNFILQFILFFIFIFFVSFIINKISFYLFSSKF